MNETFFELVRLYPVITTVSLVSCLGLALAIFFGTGMHKLELWEE